MKNSHSVIGEAVAIMQGVLTVDECDMITQHLSTAAWTRHSFDSWDEDNQKTTHSYDDDLEVLWPMDGTDADRNVAHEIERRLRAVLADYDYHQQFGGWTGMASIRYNRYATGTRMHRHWDAIRALFGSGHRGIPMISMVGMLNDNYEGGEFVMWDDTVIPIPKGAVLVFPSTFLYSHEVRTITKGERLSFVSWAW